MIQGKISVHPEMASFAPSLRYQSISILEIAPLFLRFKSPSSLA
jgi:hypothetical protein